MELRVSTLRGRRIRQDGGRSVHSGSTLSSLIEKAHQLAASGRFLSVTDIRGHLHREGYTHFELTALNGKAMRKTLRKLIDGARASLIAGEQEPRNVRQNYEGG